MIKKAIIFILLIFTLLTSGCSTINSSNTDLYTVKYKNITIGCDAKGFYKLEGENRIKFTDEDVYPSFCFNKDKIFYIVNNYKKNASLQSINIDGSNVHRIINFDYSIPSNIEFTDIDNGSLIFIGTSGVYDDQIYKLNLEDESLKIIYDGRSLNVDITSAKIYKGNIYFSTRDEDSYLIKEGQRISLEKGKINFIIDNYVYMNQLSSGKDFFRINLDGSGKRIFEGGDDYIKNYSQKKDIYTQSINGQGLFID